MYSILPRLQIIRFFKARKKKTTMEKQTTTIGKVENSQYNTVKVHEMKNDLRYFVIVEMQRTEVNETNGEEKTHSTFAVAIGNQLITDQFATKRDAINYIKSKPYQIIIAIIAKFYENAKNFETK